MIIGTGVDIINIKRIEKTINRFGDKFITKIFTGVEQQYCKAAINERKIIRYANRFAAKEACLKAIGEVAGISWQDIAIYNNIYGKPCIKLFNQAKTTVLKLTHGANYHIHLSLSDDVDYCVAYVIIEN